MWVLDLTTDQGGGSYGMYLMTSHDFGFKNDVEEAVGNIIKEFEAAGNDEWSTSDIAAELNSRGFKNEYIDCHAINI